jgi:hypothetical protein
MARISGEGLETADAVEKVFVAARQVFRFTQL